MPKREDEYWAAEKDSKNKGRCPKCGSDNISYNTNYQSWRCNKCENSFPGPNRILDRHSKPREEQEQTNGEEKVDDGLSPNSKAWFGNEYFDKKKRKWKKPGYKTSAIIISILALIVVIGIVVFFVRLGLDS